MKTLLILAALVFALPEAQAQQYVPIQQGMCEDVGLPCIKLVAADTVFYFAVIENGRVIAVTKMTPDGKETVIEGTLPPKKGEHRL